MNRRELLTGLAASLAAINIPIPPEIVAYDCSPAMGTLPTLKWLEQIRYDIINKIVNSPYILRADGSIQSISMENYHISLININEAIRELRP